MTVTHPRPVDDTLDKEGDGVAGFANRLHRLLMAGVSEVDPVHLVKHRQRRTVLSHYEASLEHFWEEGFMICVFFPPKWLILTSTILSPVFSVLFCPAGLSSRMCLMKMPLITSPLLSRLPIPRPPTILMPSDLPGSRKSSTLRSVGSNVAKLGSDAYCFKVFSDTTLFSYQSPNLPRKKNTGFVK